MCAEVHTTSVQCSCCRLGETRAAPVCRGGAAVGGTRWWGCCRVGPLRPLLGPVDPPRRTACLLAPDAGRAQALARLPPCCRRPERHTPAPSTAGRPLCSVCPQTPELLLLLNSRFPAGSGKRCSGSLLLLDAPLPPGLSSDEGSRRKGCRRPPPTRHRFPATAPMPVVSSVGSAAA